MKGVVRNLRADFHGVNPHPKPSARPGQLAPEQNASSTSGTYFRAVRPTEAEAAAVARGEQIFDAEKVERLRSTIEAAMWRSDPEWIAQRMLDDAS
jgi:anti-sigma28 factor (negative regulator of flagellin synthesis)